LVICTTIADLGQIRAEGEFTVVLPAQPDLRQADIVEATLVSRRDAVMAAFDAFSQGKRTRQDAFEAIATLMGLPAARVKRFIKSALYVD
jgi:hypothetical protein